MTLTPLISSSSLKLSLDWQFLSKIKQHSISDAAKGEEEEEGCLEQQRLPGNSL